MAPCYVCNEPGVFLCTRCLQPYCSAVCQAVDWHTHKRICFAIPRLINPKMTVADANISISTECLIECAPLRKLTIQTDEDTATAKQLSNLKSFQQQFDRDQINVGFQNDNQLKIEGNTRSPPLPIMNLDDLRSGNLISDDSIDSNTNQTGHLKADNETSIVNSDLQEQIPPNLYESTSKLHEISRMMSKPLLDPISKQANTTMSSTSTDIWRATFPMEENVFIPVVVQCTAEDPHCAWVLLQQNERACNKLFNDINCIISSCPNVRANEINLNQLYLIPYDNVYYRGVNLEVNKATGLLLMRLIDYGNEIYVSNDVLKEATPAMKHLNAFAFQVRFPAPRQLEIGDTFNIRIKPISESISDGNLLNIFVEMENNFATKYDLKFIPIPIGVKTNLYCLDFSNIDKGYVSACVNDAEAMCHIEEMNEKISAYCKCCEDIYHPRMKELCLAKYEDGEWYRGVTLKVIDSDMFSIMFIDYGNITMLNSSDIRKMREEFMHPCLMNVCFIMGAPEKPTNEFITKASSYFSENVFSIESATKQTDNGYSIDIPDLQW